MASSSQVMNGVLKDIVSYQTDSIVSRTLIDKKTGSITIFAFDKGQKLSEHTTPYDAFVLVLDGECEIQINKKPYLLHEGEFIIMPANVPHAVYASEKFKMLLAMIKKE